MSAHDQRRRARASRRRMTNHFVTMRILKHTTLNSFSLSLFIYQITTMAHTYFRVVIVEFGNKLARFDVVHVVMCRAEAGHNARLFTIDEVDTCRYSFA